MNMDFTPPARTDFAVADAVALLDEFESLTQRYYSLTGRSLTDDRYLRDAVASVVESSDLVQEDEAMTPETCEAMQNSAFLVVLASGEQVAHLGEDQHWQEANYYQHLSDTEDALRRAGVRMDATTNH